MLQKMEDGHILPNTSSHNPEYLDLLWTPGNTDTDSRYVSEHADSLWRATFGPNTALTESVQIKNSDTNLEELTLLFQKYPFYSCGHFPVLRIL